MYDEEPLWVCHRCHLNPDPTWHTWVNFGVTFHYGFDMQPCGPVSAIEAFPSEKPFEVHPL